LLEVVFIRLGLGPYDDGAHPVDLWYARTEVRSGKHLFDFTDGTGHPVERRLIGKSDDWHG
jgi:hypothetical protein